MINTSTQLFKEELAEVRKNNWEDYWSGKKASLQKTASDFRSENRPAASQISSTHVPVLLQNKHRFTSTVITGQPGPHVILRDVRNLDKVKRTFSQELPMLPVYTAPEQALLAL